MGYLFFGIFIGWLIFGGSPSSTALTGTETYAVLGWFGVGCLIASVLMFRAEPIGAQMALMSGVTTLGGATGYWYGAPETGLLTGFTLAMIVFAAQLAIACVQLLRDDRERRS